MKRCFVGFDTSNYTTSVAVCTEGGQVVANIKRPLPVKEGECGLRQSDAVFAHIKNLPTVTDELSRVLADGYEVAAVGVSARPRDAEDSYMPCFLSGVAAAHSFAAARGIPVYDFSHQNGHIRAAAYSSGQESRLFEGRFLTFHVSGGTTEALLAEPSDCGFCAELVGGTLDLNAGQVIDRVGVSLGLSFPCGAELEKLAQTFVGRREKIKTSVKDGWCNLSGLQNMAAALYAKTQDKNAVSAFVFDFVCETLINISAQLTEKYGEMPVLFAGGVMSNRYMRRRISERFEAYFAEPEFSADNAAGVALLCREKHLAK